MKKNVELTEEMLSNPLVNKHERDDLRKDIEQYYLGKTSSNIGLGLIQVDWTTRRVETYAFFRQDVLTIQFWDVANVFVDSDSYVSIQPWSGIELSTEEKERIRTLVAKEIALRTEFLEEQAEWLFWWGENRRSFDGLLIEELHQRLVSNNR